MSLPSFRSLSHHAASLSLAVISEAHTECHHVGRSSRLPLLAHCTQPATRQPGRGMPTNGTTSTDSDMRLTRRATAAAGEERPRAEEGLTRAGAVQQRATRGGALHGFSALGSFYVATEAAPTVHRHAHAVARVAVFNAEGDDGWGAGGRRYGRGKGEALAVGNAIICGL
jgi:hypothetical protein